MSVLSAFCIACFPINPLILTGVLEPGFCLPLYVCGWVFWALGMLLILAPIIMFPRRGAVPKGRSFVHTTKVVDAGFYAVVRHPQYLGGVLALFVATPLLYPHWLFVVLGIPGIVILAWSTREEERGLMERFGDDYRSYMRRVPRMNIAVGIIRRVNRRKPV